MLTTSFVDCGTSNLIESGEQLNRSTIELLYN